MPNDEPIATIIDHLLATPQAGRILSKVENLIDRVGDRLEKTIATSSPNYQAPPQTPAPDPNLEYYKVLGLDPSASRSEIKVAFTTLIKKHHPDKFANHSEAQKEATEKTAAIIEAYRKLTKDASCP